jgi:hypothetical protein
MQADIVDDGLDGLETHLRAIRDLLSDEAGAVMAERDDIIGNPWHRLGWYRRRLLHYNARLQALLNVKTYRNAASVYVASVRSRLRMVGKELKVLRMLAGEPARANRVLPMKPFVQALRAGVARLRHAQIALSGSFGEERRPMVAPLVEEN